MRNKFTREEIERIHDHQDLTTDGAFSSRLVDPERMEQTRSRRNIEEYFPIADDYFYDYGATSPQKHCICCGKPCGSEYYVRQDEKFYGSFGGIYEPICMDCFQKRERYLHRREKEVALETTELPIDIFQTQQKEEVSGVPNVHPDFPFYPAPTWIYILQQIQFHRSDSDGDFIDQF